MYLVNIMRYILQINYSEKRVSAAAVHRLGNINIISILDVGAFVKIKALIIK